MKTPTTAPAMTRTRITALTGRPDDRSATDAPGAIDDGAEGGAGSGAAEVLVRGDTSSALGAGAR